jgi:cbb3-type cytochrome oxidase cytochrome c subunit
MNYGAVVFLALASSWCGMVLAPQLQVGRQEFTTNSVNSALYPPRRPGLAEQGAEVYRANGCAACHSQSVRQTGTVFDVTMAEAGTNTALVLGALTNFNSRLDSKFLASLPANLLTGVGKLESDAAAKAFKETGAKVDVRVRATGPDIDRGWGLRANVAQDYLQDAPVMLGASRIGPDLANIGARSPDANWHLEHLYNPKSKVADSTMPPYRFLFEKRRIGRLPSADALKAATDPGFEVVPTAKAQALVAYLQSLRSDAPLFEAPFSAPVAPSTTNSPSK